MGFSQREHTTGPQTLLEICVNSAASSNYWNVQRRTLERLPEHAADSLLAALLARKAINVAHQLELFKWSVSEVDLRGCSWVGAEHIAYLAEFIHLRRLLLARCTRLKDTALSPLPALSSSLRALDLSGCPNISSRALQAVSQLVQLQHLDLSETGIRPPLPPSCLQCLTGLTCLRLGGLAINDGVCSEIAALTGLRELSLWSADITDACGLQVMLPALQHVTCLDLSWTPVTRLPALPALQVLSMQHCDIQGVLWPDQDPALGLQLAGCRVPALHPADSEDLLPALLTAAPGPDAAAVGSTIAAVSCGGSGGMASLLALLRASAPTLELLDMSGVTNFSNLHACFSTEAMAAGDDGSAVAPGGSQQRRATPSLGPSSPCLTALDLSNTAVGDADLAVLLTEAPALQQLMCTGCTQIGTAGIASLIGLSSLKRLGLSGTCMSDDSLGWLLQLTSLKDLDLSHTSVTGCLVPAPENGDADVEAVREAAPWAQAEGVGSSNSSGSWGTLHCLRSLNLLGTRVTDAGVAAVGALGSSLTSLKLGGAALTDKAVRSIATQLTRVKTLSLHGCEGVTGLGLSTYLGGPPAAGTQSCPRLARLEVPGCWLVSKSDLQRLLEHACVLAAVCADGELLLSGGLASTLSAGSTAALGGTDKAAGAVGKQQLEQKQVLESCDQRFRYTLGQLKALSHSPLVHASQACAVCDLPAELICTQV